MHPSYFAAVDHAKSESKLELNPRPGSRRLTKGSSEPRKVGQRNWQLELLCNVGAAELTIPAGSFPVDHDAGATIEDSMRLRKDFQRNAQSIAHRAPM